MVLNWIACFQAPFLILEYIRFVLQMIFVLENCESRGTCENRRLFQGTCTCELRQKMSIKTSNYYLISWRLEATEKIVVSWLEVSR